MRLGLFGGTFDPPHVGHLLAASDAYEALALDLLVLVPAAVQPLKAAEARAPAPDRLEMVRRLCQGDARFAVDSIEVDRGGVSFTIDTLRAYRGRYPDAALFLLIGADVVNSLPLWREHPAVLALAEVVVLSRADLGPGTWDLGHPGADLGRGTWDVNDLRRIPTRRVDVSATEIRERVRTGKSIRGFVTDSVAEYIAERRLYI